MELEKGDLESQPVFTFIRTRHKDVESGGWRYMLMVPAFAGNNKMWLDDTGTRWPSRDVKADVIELLWHPQGLHAVPEPFPAVGMANVRVLQQVANSHEKQRTAPPRLTPPGDFEPENYATDGSRDAELADLRAQVTDLAERLRQSKALLLAARTSVENMSGLQEVRRDGALAKELREIRMVLQGGDAIRRTARAEEVVEEWLQDPHRSIFGLAADLSTILGPTQGAWKK